MKKYLYLAALLIAYNCCAMELAKLSSEDDAKCSRFARYLDKYPEGKSEDEKSSLLIAVCKELPFDTQKLIFDIMHQSIKEYFINKTITAFEKSFQKETESLTANINLAKDFKSRMRNDLLTLLQEPTDKKLTLSCSLYVDCPQFNPIQAINCAHVIGLFNKTEQEYQELLDILVEVKENADIVKLYIQFMTYLAPDKFLRSISCQKSKMNIGSVYNMVTDL
jgi:hypothetical protein